MGDIAQVTDPGGSGRSGGPAGHAATSAPDQVRFDPEELLASHPGLEALVVGNRRCHGGLDGDGRYVSPRTLHRVPAIAAWQRSHRETFGTDLVDIGLDQFPGPYPNVEQARILIEAGVPEPVIATLTRIGTVEGFGAFLRYSMVPDLQRHFDEDISDTALGHLDRGLIEAHARDEAGDPASDAVGHDQMWFAARDLAFEDPVTVDETVLMLQRMGIAPPGSAKVDPVALRAAAMANRRLPDDVDFDLEALVDRMVRLVLIEISAFHTFIWAEALLGDEQLVAGDGRAGTIVSWIRADETPHVEYLRTALTELRERTVVGTGGRRHDGAALLEAIWEPAVAEQRGAQRTELLDATWKEVRRAVAGRRDEAELLDRFDAAGTTRRRPDGTWHDPTVAELTAA
jgi:hypothetical protein